MDNLRKQTAKLSTSVQTRFSAAFTIGLQKKDGCVGQFILFRLD
jgi:hypothetical protein